MFSDLVHSIDLAFPGPGPGSAVLAVAVTVGQTDMAQCVRYKDGVANTEDGR